LKRIENREDKSAAVGVRGFSLWEREGLRREGEALGGSFERGILGREGEALGGSFKRGMGWTVQIPIIIYFWFEECGEIRDSMFPFIQSVVFRVSFHSLSISFFFLFCDFILSNYTFIF